MTNILILYATLKLCITNLKLLKQISRFSRVLAQNKFMRQEIRLEDQQVIPGRQG